MLGNLAVPHAHDIDGLELNFATSRRDAEEVPFVRAMISLIRRDAIAVGKLPMDFSMKVGESRAEDFVQFSRPSLVWRPAWLRASLRRGFPERLWRD